MIIEIRDMLTVSLFNGQALAYHSNIIMITRDQLNTLNWSYLVSAQLQYISHTPIRARTATVTLISSLYVTHALSELFWTSYTIGHPVQSFCARGQPRWLNQISVV